MKLRNLAAVLGLAGGGLLAGQAQAFLIEDFNTATGYNAVDTTPDGNHAPKPYHENTGETVSAAPTSGNTVWNSLGGGAGISRTIYAELDTTDNVTTEICNVCQAGHITAGAGVTPSTGNHYFEWSGPDGVIMTDTYDTFKFQWGADQPNAAWYVTFFDDATPFMSSEVTGLPATPGPGSLTHMASISLASFIPDAQLPTIDRIRLSFNGVGALDANIDNVQLVPEPSVLALLSAGLLGLGWQRRRRRAG